MSNFRTSKGKKFHIIFTYFLLKEVGYEFTPKEETGKILHLYQQTFPNDNVNNTTWLYDSLRTLTLLGGPIIKISGSGKYKKIREFDRNKDYVRFIKNFYKKDAKGKQYKN